ncbi:MAG: hypothetical protein KDB00_01255 [Planctomycetales bacterium]|nr:hypothetical protein [Planctomycetales bacterium]
MKKFTIRNAASAIGLALFTTAASPLAFGQDAPSQNRRDAINIEVASKTTPESITTLDDIRNLGTSVDLDISFTGGDGGGSGDMMGGEPYAGAGYDGMAGMMGGGPPNPLKTAADRIRVLKKQLSSPKTDRTKAEAEIKSALNDYFIADMRQRVRELDELKQKLAYTEKRLQERLAQRAEAVDVQLKIMLREADGGGFFRPEDAQNISGAASRSN